MVIVLTLTKKANKDISGDWVNSKILEIAFTFVHGDVFDQAVIDMGLVDDFGVSPRDEDKIIRNQYDGCVISFDECMFSFIVHCFPFNEFEIGILNHLLITLL